MSYLGKNILSTIEKSFTRISRDGLDERRPTDWPIPGWMAAVNSEVGF